MVCEQVLVQNQLHVHYKNTHGQRSNIFILNTGQLIGHWVSAIMETVLKNNKIIRMTSKEVVLVT